jgi:Tol biopolymer transport system component
MNHTDDLEHDLTTWFAATAAPSTPDFVPDILQRTARASQRPRWSFPERWLPMATITSRLAPMPRIPWRAAGLLALLLIALVAGAVLVAGSPARLPAPFGLAANGLVAYAADGDIYTVDPASGAATVIVTGPEIDLAPVWSRDGTRFVFLRVVDGPAEAGALHVARPDGGELVAVTSQPLVNVHRYSFSPDGHRIVFLTEVQDGQRMLWTANADGSDAAPFELGMGADWPSYRPDGTEILFAGQAAGPLRNGIYAIDVASSAVRTIVGPSPEPFLESLSWSPDGSQIAYVEWTPGDEGTCSKVVHVVSADGTRNRTLPLPAGASCDEPAAWSNDGTRLVVIRSHPGSDQAVLAIVPADGSGLGIETTRATSQSGGLSGWTAEWAPDDTMILATPVDADDTPLPQVLVDPATGASRPAPWAATSQPTWQRRAP